MSVNVNLLRNQSWVNLLLYISRDSILDSIHNNLFSCRNRESSRELRLVTDCQLTFERCFTTIHVSGVVTLIFFLIVHQACWTRHFICNLIGACDVAITSIRIFVIAIEFSITKTIIILSNMFTCIRKYQFIKRRFKLVTFREN